MLDKIFLTFNKIYPFQNDAEKAAVLALASTFIKDNQWLVGKEESILLLRKESLSSPLTFINTAIKTLVVPVEYQDSIVQSLQQECIVFFAEKLSVYVARPHCAVNNVSIKIGQDSVSTVLKLLQGYLNAPESVYINFTFTKDALLWVEEQFPQLNAHTTAPHTAKKAVPENRAYSQMWDHWYG